MRATKQRPRALRTAGALVVAGAGTLAAVGGGAAAWAQQAPACANGICAVTYATPGTGQSFTVPPGVSALSFTLYGAMGGADTSNPKGPIPGGDGAGVQASLTTQPGATIGVDVGGAGIFHSGTNPGGANGGGSAFDSGSGGGATDVTSAGSDLLVAGGGGGAGAVIYDPDNCLLESPPSVGGGTGGNAGTAGGPGPAITAGSFSLSGGGGGGGGTSTSGGAGGSGGTFSGSDPCPSPLDVDGAAGPPGVSGTGGSGTEETAGGGGGGGYFGGGAGGAGAYSINLQSAVHAPPGGGGGGSSYGGGAGITGYIMTDTGNSGQVNAGNGEALLSYPDPVVARSPAFEGTADQVLSVPASAGLLSLASVSAPAGDTLTASGPAGGGTAQGGTVAVNADGSFSYTPPAGYLGADTFGYTVTDSSGDYSSGTATIQVGQIQQAITFTSTAPSPGVVGTTYTPGATGGGSGNPVTFSIDPASTDGACSLDSGVVSFTGDGTCVLDADQSGGGLYAAAPQVSQSITVDTAPSFSVDSPPLTATAGQVYSYTFGASGTPSPAYALAPDAPAWLAFDASTGTVTGTPPAGTTSFSYSVTAANPAGTATAGPYTVTVGAAPTPKANLAITLSCPATMALSGTVTCSLTVVNHGPATAHSIVTSVKLNTVLAETGCDGCKHSGGVYLWKQSSLASGVTVAHTVTLAGTRAGAGTVTASTASSTDDPHPANNVSTRQIRVKT